MNAKQAILAKLKAAQGNRAMTDLPDEPDYPLSQLDSAEQYRQWVELLERNQAVVIETVAADIAEVVTQQMKRLGLKSLLYGENTPFAAQFKAFAAELEATAFDFELDTQAKAFLFEQVDAGITTCHSAIAALGAIVLWPDKNEPRTLSLVPSAHFVVVRREQLYADWPTLLKQQQWQENLPTNVLLISGPSKTGDIQQYMAFGAHGPKHLIVLVV